MECDKPNSERDQAESLIYVILNAVLAVVLVASLAVGGRDVLAMSAKPVLDRASNIVAP